MLWGGSARPARSYGGHARLLPLQHTSMQSWDSPILKTFPKLVPDQDIHLWIGSTSQQEAVPAEHAATAHQAMQCKMNEDVKAALEYKPLPLMP